MMQRTELEVPVSGSMQRMDARFGESPPSSLNDVSIGDLFKRLSTDTGELIRQEGELVKVEMRNAISGYAKDVQAIGIAAALGVIGALCLVAFLVIGLGNLLGSQYWLSALIIGVVVLTIGAIMVSSAVKDMKNRSLVPEKTLGTLREDKQWASQQARELAHDLSSDPTTDTTPRR